jgi:hypothetical protein
MIVSIDPKLEVALREEASRQGLAPEEFVVNLLRTRLIDKSLPEPRDDWERGLLANARPWGVSLSDHALSSEGLYD